jgi:hypothetical protein
MNIKDCEGGKLLILSKPFDTRVKFLEACYSFFFLVSFCLAFIPFFIGDLTSSGAFVWLVAIIVSFLIFKRFANKAFLSERILVTRNEITLIKKRLFSSEKASYDIGKISHFRHLAKPELTRHPLAGDHYDYLGFQTEQQLINDVHGDNRLSFQYDGKTITFGDNLYSWDFEQLEMLLYDITGNDLRYEDSVEQQMLSELDKTDDKQLG